MATFYNQLTGALAATSTVTKSQLTPWRTRWFTTTVTSTVTTTMRVVGGIHNNTTDGWADTLTALATGRTDFDILMLYVTDNTDGSSCFNTEFTDFTRWHTNLSVVALFCHKLCLCSGSTYHLSTLAGVDLDGINLRTDWNIRQWHAV